MNNINTFQKRDKAQEIYNTFFDPYSENVFDSDVLNTLNFYGVIDDKDYRKLSKIMDKIGDKLYDEIKDFEKRLLDKINSDYDKNA